MAHSHLALPLDANLEADARHLSPVVRDIARRQERFKRGVVTELVSEEERLAALRDLNSILTRLEDLKKSVEAADVLETTALDDLLVRLRRAIGALRHDLGQE